jgi:hypothetical protein
MLLLLSNPDASLSCLIRFFWLSVKRMRLQKCYQTLQLLPRLCLHGKVMMA